MRHHKPLTDLRRWRTLFLAATAAAVPSFIAVVVLLALQSAPHHARVITGAISIGQGGFQPATLTVKASTIVTWTNTDSQQNHWVEADPYPHPSDPADLTSDRLISNMRYSYTFAKPGTYHYHDRLNPTHSGTIIVQ